MKTIFLDAGHGAGDPGAPNSELGFTEEKLAIQFVDKLEALLKQRMNVIKYSNAKNSYKDNAYSAVDVYDLYAEFHLNASTNKSAVGSEVLVTSKYEPDATDNGILNALAKFFSNRGIKSGDALQNVNVCANRALNYRLVELCFISNNDEVKYFVKYMDNIALEVANAILKSLGLEEINEDVVENETKYYLTVENTFKDSYYKYVMKINKNRSGAFFADSNCEKAIGTVKNLDDDYIITRYHSNFTRGGYVWFVHEFMPNPALNLPDKVYCAYKLQPTN